MSVKRVMGTETEYAISRADGAHSNPVRLSFDVIDAAADDNRRHIRWDYRQEDPVNDARGTRLERAAARPDMLTDAPQLNITNVIAPNGGRMYVDHAHPEYSAPETVDPFEAVRYDHAGDLLMQQAAEQASARGDTPIVLHRNNVDGKGASWGTHENYMMARSVPFDAVVALMIPHFVSRQIYTGSGRVGIGERSETAGYQLSQRADYIGTTIGLQTTFDRPIINTRDESHSTSQYRRLHVIVGDGNRMDVPQVLKLGVTSMLLWLLETANKDGYDLQPLLDTITLADPVAAMHTVSHDLTLSAPLPLLGGGETTAWIIQVKLRAAVYEVAAAAYGTDTRGEPAWPDKSTASIMAMWGQALADVATVRHADDDARLTLQSEASRLEWLMKWQLLERLRRRRSMSWSDPRLAAVDLAWAAVDPTKSVFEKVRSRTERTNTDDDVRTAAHTAPDTTRAWLRAAIVNRYPWQVVAASWSHITVRTQASLEQLGITDSANSDDNAQASALAAMPQEQYGNASRPVTRASDLFSLDMSDPLLFDRAHTQRAVEQTHDAEGLLREVHEIITGGR
ncbi:ligase [Bifidobacterium goeldii]|uniref:Ligase n=1 Tax=Bifidobacterium goeldii TaxID=2306975 RepID=A0A430FK07_9BIFI|nr:depupylase/deamidase Dop [Bifidobacterium goeldii]RSX53120.1 ligase [Bifidobacterium goeldii]